MKVKVGAILRLKGLLHKKKLQSALESVLNTNTTLSKGCKKCTCEVCSGSYDLKMEELDLSAAENPRGEAQLWLHKRYVLDGLPNGNFGQSKHWLVKIAADEHWLCSGYQLDKFDTEFIRDTCKLLGFTYTTLADNNCTLEPSSACDGNEINLTLNIKASARSQTAADVSPTAPFAIFSCAKQTVNSHDFYSLPLTAAERATITQVQRQAGATIEDVFCAANLLYFNRILGSSRLKELLSADSTDNFSVFENLADALLDDQLTVGAFIRQIGSLQSKSGDCSTWLKRSLQAETDTIEGIKLYPGGQNESYSVDFGNSLEACLQIVRGDATNGCNISCLEMQDENSWNLQVRAENKLVPMSEFPLFAKRILHIIGQLSNPETVTCGQINVLPDDEKTLLEEFGCSTVDYPSYHTIVNIFEEQAARNSSNTAVVFEEVHLTFEELNQRANQLANYLVSKGIAKESLVPVCFERSQEMIMAILAILKVGAAYVPIDPDYPPERMAYILNDTAANIVITNSPGLELKLNHTGINVVLLSTFDDEISQYPSSNLEIKVSPHQLAYVIYTSGSTGKPKGVMIEHKALLDHCFGIIQAADLSTCRSFALFSPLVFDAGHSIIHAAFILRASMHVLSTSLLANGEKLHAYIQKNSIDCIKIVPSIWLSYAEGENLVLARRVMIYGGEAFPKTILDRLKAIRYSGCVYNHYGPTETTIGKCIHRIDFNTPYTIVPIGRPFSNTKIYILDDASRPLPVGVSGQLYIAGDGLARGYLNQPVLTRDSFVKDCFDNSPVAKMYKTGDLAKWLPDGNIEYIGRKDEQVKIRGYRIELGEIERKVLESEMIRAVVVLTSSRNNGSIELAACVIPNRIFQKDELILYLKQGLPEYMIPHHWLAMEKFPLTINGKIDRKLLTQMVIEDQPSRVYTAPHTILQQQLAAGWKQLLHIESIGIHDNVWELGGNSLMAMRMISSMRKLSQIEIPLSSFFTHPTIAQLADYLERIPVNSDLVSIQKYTRPLRLPLSFGQNSLWFIDQLRGSLAYHLPTVLKIEGKLDTAALSFAIMKVLTRHEALRTVIREEMGVGYQVVLSAAEWQMDLLNEPLDGDVPQVLEHFVENLIAAPFDLARDYMLRASVLRLAPLSHVLVLTVHHIASDGWSSSILMKEIGQFYDEYCCGKIADLAPLPVQYADYALWQQEQVATVSWEKKLHYWRSQLQDVPALQPLLESADEVPSEDDKTISLFRIGEDLTAQLNVFSKNHGTTLFVSLLTTLKVLLYRYTGQEDLCVGTPLAGRPQQELEGLIGLFINTVAIRTRLSKELTFAECLQQVKATMLEAHDNQDIPFEKVVDEVVHERVVDRNPLFQVMFVLQNTPGDKSLKFGDLQISPLKAPIPARAKFPLSFIITEINKGLDVSIEYEPGLFKAASIKSMQTSFEELLASAVKNPAEKISKLPLLSRQQQDRILFEYNQGQKGLLPFVSIVTLFERQAADVPGNVALKYENKVLTYRQLNEHANELARHLQLFDVGGTLIPICVERGLEMLIGILAILKSGAAYVPVEPGYPAERIRYMLEDSGAVLLLTTQSCLDKIPVADKLRVICIDEKRTDAGTESKANLTMEISPGDLAYVIYTSGSTGTPKGTLVNHRAMAASITTRNEYYGVIGPMLLLPSFAFDSSIATIFGTLTNGASLLLSSEAAIKDPALLKRMLRQTQTLLCVPSYYRFLLEEGLVQNAGITRVILGGETMDAQLARQHFKLTEGISLYNEYGPTEAAIWSSVANITPETKTITIGKPIRTVTIYILDGELQLVPVGVPGEICLAGPQLANGYLNLPEMTTEKFVADPFKMNAEKMYKTGDFGRWLPDGSIEYLGRNDEQVKVNGYRIELSGVERVLRDYKPIEQAIVVAGKDNSGNNRLVGYVKVTEPITQEQLVDYLNDRLPAYSIPRAWVFLDAFPLTYNGKIDKAALPKVTHEWRTSKEAILPSNDLEKKVAAIWTQLLGVHKISIHDNFFELGGHSLLAMRLVAIMRRQVEMPVSVSEVFIYPTIATLCDHLLQKTSDPALPSVNFRCLVPIKKGSGKYPLYIVAGGGGTALRFKPLAQMLAFDQPVCVLQAPLDRNELEHFPSSIEGIAGKFIEELISQDPEGPYSLAGHCIGGIIALEMARQLHEKGKQVNLLTMLDTVIDEWPEQPAKIKLTSTLQNGPRLPLFSNLMLKTEFQLFLLWKHTRQFFAYKLNSFAVFKKHEQDSGELHASMEALTYAAGMYLAAKRKYRLPRYHGDIIVFYARERYFFTDLNHNIRFKKTKLQAEVKNRWKLYGNRVDIYELEGDHSNMFNEERASELARLLQSKLDNFNKN